VNEEMALKVVEYDAMNIKYIPDQFKQIESEPKVLSDMSIKALEKNPTCFKFLPKDLILKEHIEKAIKYDFNNIKYINENFKDLIDKELAHYVISKDSMMLKFIPAEAIDKNICLDAVRSNGLSIEHVPKEIKDDEYVEIAKNATE